MLLRWPHERTGGRRGMCELHLSLYPGGPPEGETGPLTRTTSPGCSRQTAATPAPRWTSLGCRATRAPTSRQTPPGSDRRQRLDQPTLHVPGPCRYSVLDGNWANPVMQVTAPLISRGEQTQRPLSPPGRPCDRTRHNHYRPRKGPPAGSRLEDKTSSQLLDSCAQIEDLHGVDVGRLVAYHEEERNKRSYSITTSPAHWFPPVAPVTMRPAYSIHSLLHCRGADAGSQREDIVSGSPAPSWPSEETGRPRCRSVNARGCGDLA